MAEYLNVKKGETIDVNVPTYTAMPFITADSGSANMTIQCNRPSDMVEGLINIEYTPSLGNNAKSACYDIFYHSDDNTAGNFPTLEVQNKYSQTYNNLSTNSLHKTNITSTGSISASDTTMVVDTHELGITGSSNYRCSYTYTLNPQANTKGIIEFVNTMINVPTPTTDSEPTTKKYVDDAIAAATGGGGGSSNISMSLVNVPY